MKFLRQSMGNLLQSTNSLLFLLTTLLSLANRFSVVEGSNSSRYYVGYQRSINNDTSISSSFVKDDKVPNRYPQPWTGYKIESFSPKKLEKSNKRNCQSGRSARCKRIKPNFLSLASPTIQSVPILAQRSASEVTKGVVPTVMKLGYNSELNNTGLDLTELSQVLKSHRKGCKVSGSKGFHCQKLKLYLWLVKKLEEKSTRLYPWLELVKNDNVSLVIDSSELGPENWPEEVVYKFLRKYGDQVDQYVFYKYKQFAKSRELKFEVPDLIEVRVAPRTHEISEIGRSTSRLFWDPGFNLKLKLPFFRDELKVAISTGPSFLAGIGTGIALLIIKSMFAPLLFGMKYMMYNIFFKGGSPWDMMKMLGYGSSPEPWESSMPPAAIEGYEPHQGHGPIGPPDSGYGATGGSGFGFGYEAAGGGGNGFDQKNQFSQLNPILQGLTGSSNEGRRQQNYYKSLLNQEGGVGGYAVTGGGSVISESQDNQHVKQPPDSNFQYIPSTAMQAEVENYDPFYSPLLSRIDSIFTHLGYQEEGCRERAVCSIYKFPVKYAPYSNLLSAQLSKHQTELKRPVTSSSKVLRYFKYMKAAKDGQGAANCMEMYPKCNNDTDSVSNLPMITTFNQLSELMGADETGPGMG